MQKFRELVSGSFTQLWEELRKHKDEFLSRLSAVGQQQQQLIEKQNAMDDRLKQVRRCRYRKTVFGQAVGLVYCRCIMVVNGPSTASHGGARLAVQVRPCCAATEHVIRYTGGAH